LVLNGAKPHMAVGLPPAWSAKDCDRKVKPPHSPYTTPPDAANAVTAADCKKRNISMGNQSVECGKWEIRTSQRPVVRQPLGVQFGVPSSEQQAFDVCRYPLARDWRERHELSTRQLQRDKVFAEVVTESGVPRHA
jgi:hypothetical protein